MINPYEGNDLMLEKIRKELMAIVEENGDSSNNKLPLNSNVISSCIQSAINDESSNKDKGNYCNVLSNYNVDTDCGCACAVPTTITTTTVTTDMPRFHNLDKDIESMRLHLDQSYELFQTIGGRFENLSFTGLLNRIKDLNLTENKINAPLKNIVDDLKGEFEDKFLNNRLHELTKDMKTKFNNHSGEFADIPEVCEFFRVCTQLENGLERLRKQRNDIANLNSRVAFAADEAYRRVDEIQKKINEQNPRETAGDIGG